MTTPFYPLLFKAVLKDYLWGGRNLATLGKSGRDLPEEGVIAESWEIAAHADGTTVVSNGDLAGKALTELLETYGLDLIGTNNKWALERNKFPLLIKILDANKSLSVQVHPDDTYALEHEGNELGKTEMWVVLQAKEGASVILGVSEGTTPELFQKGIETGTLEPYLHHIPVKAGDHICVPAGSLHAIMDGLMIAEIQQNSNTTYRVYDWNRVGVDGKPRDLHIEKAMQTTNFAQVAPTLCPAELIANEAGVSRFELCRNNYFVTERVEMTAGSSFESECDGSSLEVWGLLEGSVSIETVAGEGVQLEPVQFTLLPAALGTYKVKTTEASVLLRSYVVASS